MKSAGKARSNGLYRHIRTSKEIIRNLLNDFMKVIQQLNKATVYKGLQAIKRNKWFDRVEKVSDFPLYFYIVAGCAD